MFSLFILFRDGDQEFSLHIPRVAPEHLDGSFRCEAREELAGDRTGSEEPKSPSSLAVIYQRISTGAVLTWLLFLSLFLPPYQFENESRMWGELYLLQGVTRLWNLDV